MLPFADRPFSGAGPSLRTIDPRVQLRAASSTRVAYHQHQSEVCRSDGNGYDDEPTLRGRTPSANGIRFDGWSSGLIVDLS